jgi:hypothetical protein
LGFPVDALEAVDRTSTASMSGNRSQPSFQPIRPATAMNASSGRLPAPAPCPAKERPRAHLVLDGDDGVGDAEGQVVVGVDPEAGGRFEEVAVGAQTAAYAVHGEASRSR